MCEFSALEIFLSMRYINLHFTHLRRKKNKSYKVFYFKM